MLVKTVLVATKFSIVQEFHLKAFSTDRPDLTETFIKCFYHVATEVMVVSASPGYVAATFTQQVNNAVEMSTMCVRRSCASKSEVKLLRDVKRSGQAAEIDAAD